MNERFNHFKNYHYQENPLIIGNIWDVPSALHMQNLGFQALGTSSAAVASMLGYEDGENIPFSEYLMIIKRIMESVEIPVTVDLEGGYGNDSETVFDNIKMLSQLGVIGINLEDSFVSQGIRKLSDPDSFIKKLQGVHEKLKTEGLSIFINLRIDTFLLQLPNAVEESLRRIDLYSRYIDGVFLPCISSENDIKQITKHTDLPLNIMSVPGLPEFDELKNLSVKRISTGGFLYDFVNTQLHSKAKSIIKTHDLDSFFS